MSQADGVERRVIGPFGLPSRLRRWASAGTLVGIRNQFGTTEMAPMTTFPDAAKLLNRLRRIEGQVRGLQRMIEEGRDCTEVVHQVAAVRAAVDRAGHEIVASSLRACLAGATLEEGVEERLEAGFTALARLHA
jgi:DNA-binding FrmR family transcriptional regulator